jgi:hypothetical protein
MTAGLDRRLLDPQAEKSFRRGQDTSASHAWLAANLEVFGPGLRALAGVSGRLAGYSGRIQADSRQVVMWPGRQVVMGLVDVFSVRTQCDGKRPYRFKSDAKHARKVMKAVGTGALAIYRCPHCGLWHLGHHVSRRRRS